VFGCGGDRDPGKRPLMGAISRRLAGTSIVTSDNPRTEDPMEIIREVLAGIDDMDNVIVEPDRRKAIRLAVSIANPGDVVIIAGKGHEDYQILGTRKIHFDDREEAMTALRELS
jgi:UDP-N-acetylmuramoyl-L-alanyl-D-glutamate--2,6-diaminopimelate ligase